MQVNSLYKGTFLDVTIPAGIGTTGVADVTAAFVASHTIIGAVQVVGNNQFTEGPTATFITDPILVDAVQVTIPVPNATANTVVRVFFNEDAQSNPTFPVV